MDLGGLLGADFVSCHGIETKIKTIQVSRLFNELYLDKLGRSIGAARFHRALEQNKNEIKWHEIIGKKKKK